MLTITLHKEQGRAFYSDKRVVAMCSGIQGGKTICGALWLLKMVNIHNKPDQNFIVTSPTHKILKQATEPEFLKRFDGLGVYNKSEMVFNMPNNRKVYLRTFAEGRQPNAIEGITNVFGIWADEAGMLNLQCWVNLQGRSAFQQCQIFITTTPYALNWLYKDIYKKHVNGERDDVEFVQFKSTDNPHFPKEEFERQRTLLDPRIFSMKYEGHFQKMAGLVFMDFDEILNGYEVFEPDREKYFICAGIDWGYTNPFAITVRAIHKTEPRDYQMAEHYESFLDPNQKVEIAKQFQKRYGITQFYADNEEPAMIKLFNSAGLPTMAAPKYPGSLQDNISRHNGLIRTRVHKLFLGKCPHTVEEYGMYHHREDDGKEQNTPENPVDSYNHLMTANMYVTQCTETLQKEVKKLYEFTPVKTRLQKLLDNELYEESADERMVI